MNDEPIRCIHCGLAVEDLGIAGEVWWVHTYTSSVQCPPTFATPPGQKHE